MTRMGAALGLGIVLSAGTANAYCRTTTCDVPEADKECTWDAHDCATSGKPLFWPDSCGWFGVQKDGSPRSHISHDTLHVAVVNAFSKWSKADCGVGALPSFDIQDTDLLYGPVECPTQEFNKKAANASTWMFRDDTWPYADPSNTIALTTLSVDLKTGRILDADVEINSFGTDITTSDSSVGADLEAIVTHESGHFLGLAHSSVASATMFQNYPGVSIRSLDPDDQAGICAVYPSSPPVCGQPEPLYGFSRYCKGVNPSTQPASSGDTGGCAIGLRAPSGASSALLGVAFASALAVRRRRRSRMGRAKLGTALGLGILLSAGAAGAYCRTTTCDVDDAQAGCTWDVARCATGGKPLFWPDGCGWFGVQKDGSTRRNISYETLHGAVVNAFSKWSKANCGDGTTPSFDMQDTDLLYGPVECAEHEFNRKAANASAWMFRDGSWPYVGTTTTIALTTLSVDVTNGRILDADVEINSFGTNITTGNANVGDDLDSIVTHESGHFLGLAHSTDSSAILFSSYNPGVTFGPLSPDDEAGICAAYPPSSPPMCGQPEPLYGFSKYCRGVNPSSQPEPRGTGGMKSDNPSTEPEPVAAGGPNGNRVPADGCECEVGRAPSSDAAGALLGVALAGIATLRRRRSVPADRRR